MKYSNIKRYLGLLLVVVLMGAALVACGNSNKPVTSKVDCSKQTTQLKAANSDLEEATAKLKDAKAKGKPSEKQYKQAVDKAQATIDALSDCKLAVPAKASADKHKVVVHIVDQALQQQGFKGKDLRFKNLKHNTAKPGSGVFGKEITTPEEAVAFLKSGTPQAKEAMKAALQQTSTPDAKTTEAQLLDPSNYAAVQIKTATDWTGNTFFSNGLQNAGSTKVDPAGTVAVVFVPPAQVDKGMVTSVFTLRGACANPQTKLPRPHKPGTPTHKPKCVPPHVMLPQGVCSEGKDANQAPVPTGGPVIHCKDGYLGRDGQCHNGTYTPPSGGGGSGGSGGGSDTGKGDSGPGATNTTAPPPTSSPAPAPPETTSPTVPVPPPTF